MLDERIIGCRGIQVYSGKGFYHTFFSSPYPSHKRFSAVDIYPGVDFYAPAYSPVEGEVFLVRSFNSPTLGQKPLPDYLIIIDCGDYFVRIMHVEPEVQAGDYVRVSDRLGTFIPSGFFSFFVDPHIHLEVREKDDYLRASGGLELEPFASSPPEDSFSGISGKVVSSGPRNSVIELERLISGRIGETPVILDGFTSLGYCGVLGSFPVQSPVCLGETHLGDICLTGSNMSIFDLPRLRVSAGGFGFSGISFMFGGRFAMLVPEKYGAAQLPLGEAVTVDIKKNEN